MAQNIQKMIAETFLEMAQGIESGSYGKRPKIALTGMGSEHGEENSMAASMFTTSAHLRLKALRLLRSLTTKKDTKKWRSCWKAVQSMPL